MLEATDRYQEIKKVTLVAVATNIFLAVLKITLGFIGQSQALIADGVHSLADLISDLIVLVAAKHGSKKADDEHPYGHGRFETLAEIALGLLLVVVAAGIFFDASLRLYEPERLLSPTWFALIAAFISIVANEGLFQYTIQVAKRLKSSLLTANAWHHRTDAISSVIALLGIGGAILGFAMLDAVAAIAVSFLIAKVGWDIICRSLRELVDTALDPEVVAKIRQIILSVDGVKAVHSLRTRNVGSNALVDVHLLVIDSRISVSEGHQISERVMHRLISEVDDVVDVTVHIDPEDDEETVPCGALPLRNDVEEKLDEVSQTHGVYQKRKRINLHYLDGRVFIEIVFPLLMTTELKNKKLIADMCSEMKKISYVADIRIMFE